MSIDKILKQSVTDTAVLLKSGEITSVELIKAVLAHAKKVNESTNAYISFREEEALKEAESADKSIQEGKIKSPFHGIPIGIKDNIFLKGEVTSIGSDIHRNYIPDKDASVVKKLREAGAVIIGKLNMHEYAWGVTNYNSHFGATRNPWNLSKITGGSSGGSGAAVASGASFASVGTDTAGSVRIPASACGIVGLKPTKGLVSKKGVFPLSDSLDHVGPMGKTVKDVAALLNILTKKGKKQAPKDYTIGLDKDISGLTVGINEEYFFNNVDARVESLVRKQIDELEKSGVNLKPVKLPGLEMVAYIGYMTILSESFTLHDENLRNRLNDFGEDIQGLYGMGIPASVDYLRAQKLAKGLKKEFWDAFKSVDALISPTLPVLPPNIGSNTVEINGKEENLNDHIMRFMFPGNITGLPCLSLPCGVADGLPIGIQVVGPEFGESNVLNIGQAIEDRVGFPFWKGMENLA